MSLANEEHYRIEAGVYADDNRWNSKIREVYSELSYDKVSLAYTEYALSLGDTKLEEIAGEYGIIVPAADFKAIQNGKDLQRKDNGEYTIVGVLEGEH